MVTIVDAVNFLKDYDEESIFTIVASVKTIKEAWPIC